jgi:hypothetical protein
MLFVVAALAVAVLVVLTSTELAGIDVLGGAIPSLDRGTVACVDEKGVVVEYGLAGTESVVGGTTGRTAAMRAVGTVLPGWIG